MKTVCRHIKCRKCGGIKARKIGAVLSDVCHPKCQGAAGNVCECKCKGKFHKGSNAKELNRILKKDKISGMTAAQKKNIARFKAAAAEAKKLRAKDSKLTQPQAVKLAFAKLYGTTSAPKKKTAAKAAGSRHKDTKSHNVNIRVMSGTKKRVGALPVGFTGKFLGWPFKVLNQFTLDGGVTAQIVELDPPGNIVAELNGRKEDIEKSYTRIFQKIAIPYAALNVAYNKKTYVQQDQKHVEKKVREFLMQLNKEVSDYNSGKDRKTKTAKPAVIKYTAKVKKLAVVDQIKSILAANTQRLKNGYTLVKGKPRIKENAIGSIKRDAVQSLKKMTDTLSAVMAEKAATKTKAAGMSAGAKKVTAAHLRDLSANERALKKRILELKKAI
jgi:hypothetical protein